MVSSSGASKGVTVSAITYDSSTFGFSTGGTAYLAFFPSSTVTILSSVVIVASPGGSMLTVKPTPSDEIPRTLMALVF
jgi:hypothetical protein